MPVDGSVTGDMEPFMLPGSMDRVIVQERRVTDRPKDGDKCYHCQHIYGVHFVSNNRLIKGCAAVDDSASIHQHCQCIRFAILQEY